MAQAGTFGAMAPGYEAGARVRWMQLLMGFIVMMAISSPQYVWTLFVPSFQKSTGSILSEVQWTITILIVLQTWLSPVQGFLVERLGPKLLIGLGALLSGAGWIASAHATTLWGLYATYGLLVFLAGNSKILIFEKFAYPGDLTSTFVNRFRSPSSGSVGSSNSWPLCSIA